MDMIPGWPVSSIPQCKWNYHEDASLELFQAIGCFEPTLIEAHQASKMICTVTSLKSRIKTSSLYEDIITSSNEVFKDSESGMAVEIRKISTLTRETAKGYLIVEQIVGSQILTLELEAKQSDLWNIACIFVKLYTRTYWKDWPHKTQFTNNAMQFIAMWCTEPPSKLFTLRGCSISGGGRNIVTSTVGDHGWG